MWKIRKLMDARGVTLSIIGSINSEELLGLQEAVSAEESPNRTVDLDLENVRLVDQHVVIYLARCESGGTQLRNCPPYIREWIDRKKAERRTTGNTERPAHESPGA